jgi:hypothetical protein
MRAANPLRRAIKESMATYTKEYTAIYRREIIGDEHLNLIVDFDIATQARAGPAIAPQQPYNPPRRWTAATELQRSAMTLQFELLHEGQFINFLKPGPRHQLFILDQCTMERRSDATAQLKADCRRPLTLKNRNTK